MELEEWLKIYQAITLTAAGKERNYWTTVGLFLLTNCLLIIPLGFLFITYTPFKGKLMATAIGTIGFLISFVWLISNRRTAREVTHWGSLLRSIEAQFAGGEFHRSDYKLFHGKEVCVSEATSKCEDWYPDVVSLSWFSRLAPQSLIGFIPIAFLLGWIVVAIAGWIIT
jgi:hypothetical protein